MVIEAGVMASDFFNDPDFVDGHHIIVSNGYLHNLFVDLLPKAIPRNM